MITINGYKLEPTVFPDGTSQVWKLPNWLVNSNHFNIDWRWEAKESEVIQLYQLVKFILPTSAIKDLYVPYLPYARQDKFGNDACFALWPFLQLLVTMGLTTITTYDVHNLSGIRNHGYKTLDFRNIAPVQFHDYVIKEVKPEALVFPDDGAANRYPHLQDYPKIVFAKKRDQSTGRIISMECVAGDELLDKLDRKNILVIDDICDGGATFLMVAEAIEKANYSIKEPYRFLVVSHGIFSNGTGKINDAFHDVYTTDSLCKTQFLTSDIFKV